MPKLVHVQIPDVADPEQQVQPQTAQSPQGDIPTDATLRAQTWSDKLRNARDFIGKTIAPFLGLDFDQMADDEANGILRAMLAWGPRTSLLNAGAKMVPAANAGTGA